MSQSLTNPVLIYGRFPQQAIGSFFLGNLLFLERWSTILHLSTPEPWLSPICTYSNTVWSKRSSDIFWMPLQGRPACFRNRLVPPCLSFWWTVFLPTEAPNLVGILKFIPVLWSVFLLLTPSLLLQGPYTHSCLKITGQVRAALSSQSWARSPHNSKVVLRMYKQLYRGCKP